MKPIVDCLVCGDRKTFRVNPRARLVPCPRCCPDDRASVWAAERYLAYRRAADDLIAALEVARRAR